MLRAALISAFAVIALSSSPVAFAQSDCKSIVKPSPLRARMTRPAPPIASPRR